MLRALLIPKRSRRRGDTDRKTGARQSVVAAIVVSGLLAVFGCASADPISEQMTDEVVPPTVTGEAKADVVQESGAATDDGLITVSCSRPTGSTIAVNKWSPNWGWGLNEIWVIPTSLSDLVPATDSTGEAITFAAPSREDMANDAPIWTFSIEPELDASAPGHISAHHPCNITQTDTISELVVGTRPGTTDILVYRTNDGCTQFVGYSVPAAPPGVAPLPTPPTRSECSAEYWQFALLDIRDGASRIVADFTEQIALERASGVSSPMWVSVSETMNPQFSPEGSKLAYLEPCWQGARFQEDLGAIVLLRQRCQDGGYLVVVDLLTMDSHVVHGSENDAAIIDGFAWSPDGSSILIQQRCSEGSGVFLPEDETRNELAACNGLWTVSATTRSAHFTPQQDRSLSGFFACPDWDTSIVDQAVWSPHGDSITVSTLAECRLGIWEIGIDSGEPERIVECPFDPDVSSGPGRCTGMKWSPDGATLAFLAEYDMRGEHSIWVLDGYGAEPRRLSPVGFELKETRQIQWSLNGKQVSYYAFWPPTGELLWVTNVDDPSLLVSVPLSQRGVDRYPFGWIE